MLVEVCLNRVGFFHPQVDKARFRFATNFVEVQPVGSPDIVLVGFEPESVRFRFCFAELARSDSGKLRDRNDWSSRMLPSRSEPGSVPMLCRIPII